MHLLTTLLLSTTTTITTLLATAYSIPPNLSALYNKHKSKPCLHPLATGFHDGQNPTDSTFTYCSDLSNKSIFLHSPTLGGRYDNMDIDCDGANSHGGNCGYDESIQDQTSFKDLVVSQYGIPDLDANIHPYVVFGNTDYDPQRDGMWPLSVMVVVCGNQLFYGIWGDTAGGSWTGEASIALAKLCFPDDGMSGDNGHVGDDVLYIGFVGRKAVPGGRANWKAGSTWEFEESIRGLGERLVATLT
ncbi:CAZyme family GH75 [Aspergillus niger]|nr:CAZyme family GH75 [Aspergillus niger]KAI2963435.1 CAZyme family GH75 [Aspergillus niger]